MCDLVTRMLLKIRRVEKYPCNLIINVVVSFRIPLLWVYMKVTCSIEASFPI